MRFFDNSEISKVKIKNGDFSIELQKGFETVTVAAPAMAQTPVSSVAPTIESTIPINTPALEISGDAIKSPMVGTFYSAPAPGSPAFVKVGDKINKGQSIGIIEAMKIMNDIEAEFDCKITDILVQDGQPVEYDMPLFAIEKI